MKLWLDAHLPPQLCRWLVDTFGIQAESALRVGMIEADDDVIFNAARDAGIDLVITKDRDFVDLLDRLGPPPKVIWLTMGNTSTANLKRILSTTLRDALDMIEQGETLVEISQVMPERGNQEGSP